MTSAALTTRITVVAVAVVQRGVGVEDGGPEVGVEVEEDGAAVRTLVVTTPTTTVATMEAAAGVVQLGEEAPGAPDARPR